MVDFETKNVADPAPNINTDGQASRNVLMPEPKVSAWQNFKNFYIANKWYFWAIFLGIIIIAVLAYFALKPRNNAPAQEANVAVSIDAPPGIASGSDLVYKIKIENNDRANLVNLQLELVYPSGVTYSSSVPSASNNAGTLFSVPDLASSQNAVVIVKTTATGNINEDKQLLVRLHYRYSNFNSEFIKEANNTVRILAANIDLQLTGPDTTNNSQLVIYQVNYKNSSDKAVNNARIQLNYPDGFVFGDSTPKPNLSQNIWNVDNLAPGADGTISFQGNFGKAIPPTTQTFTVDFLVQDASGQFYPQATNKFITNVTSLPLLINQALENGNAQSVVSPGDRLSFVVTYKNNSQVAARGVNVVVTLDPKGLDIGSIETDTGEVNSNTITWDATSVPAFETLNPNGNGQFRYSVKVSDPVTTTSAKNVQIKSSIKIKSDEYTTSLPGNDITLKVATQATMDASLVSTGGPLPPKVGNSTTYQVTLTLRNATNDINDTLVTGFIPGSTTDFNVKSVNAKELANVSFDSSTKKLTWKVGLLPAHTGDSAPARKLTFIVTVTPISSQIGREVVIFKDIAFAGKDVFTGQDVSLDTNDITTQSIENNGFVNGRVVP